MLHQYLSVLDTFLTDLTPLAVGWMALRRFVLSRSFNRVLYALTILHCAMVVSVAGQFEAGDAILRAFGHSLGYSPILLWIVVLELTDRMRPNLSYEDGLPPRMFGHFRGAPDPAR